LAFVILGCWVIFFPAIKKKEHGYVLFFLPQSEEFFLQKIRD
jgi:hypothetical protein